MELRLIRGICLMAAILLAGEGAVAQTGGLGQLQQEEDLRAALVLGFARFTEWPGPREGAIVIGVYGRASLAAALERVSAGKTVNGRSVQVRQLRAGSPSAGCSILYYGRLPGPKLKEAMAEPRGAVLTIGEDDRFLGAGGAVYLFEEDGRISFEANLAALQAASVTISSKLLRLGYTTGAGRRGRPAL
jgi:hypothetical protein